MNIIVTGGSGFIGSHLVDALIREGHTVSVLDVRPPHRSDAKHFAVDLLDFDALCTALKGAECVYHLAAVSNVNEAFANPLLAERVNSGGTINLLEASRRNDIKRFIYASTVWVYDNCKGEQPFTEEQQLASPKHLYTATKVAGEMLVRSYTELYGTNHTILRYGIPYGPRGRRGTVVTTFLENAMKGIPLRIYGDGSNYRYFLYVTDLVSGNVLALDKKASNQTYNIEGSEKITVLRIVETIQRLLGREVAVERYPPREGEFVPPLISAEKATRELGWKQFVSFDEGMRICLDEQRALVGVVESIRSRKVT